MCYCAPSPRPRPFRQCSLSRMQVVVDKFAIAFVAIVLGASMFKRLRRMLSPPEEEQRRMSSPREEELLKGKFSVCNFVFE